MRLSQMRLSQRLAAKKSKKKENKIKYLAERDTNREKDEFLKQTEFPFVMRIFRIEVFPIVNFQYLIILEGVPNNIPVRIWDIFYILGVRDKELKIVSQAQRIEGISQKKKGGMWQIRFILLNDIKDIQKGDLLIGLKG